MVHLANSLEGLEVWKVEPRISGLDCPLGGPPLRYIIVILCCSAAEYPSKLLTPEWLGFLSSLELLSSGDLGNAGCLCCML
jgi:hypothetical protein